MNSIRDGRGFLTGLIILAGLASSARAGVGGSGGDVITNYIENGTNYTAHIYTNIGAASLTVTSGGFAEVLVVAGGGGGGTTMGGGGGAGGLVYTSAFELVVGAYDVVVGEGGLGGFAYNLAGQAGTRGSNSSFGVDMIAIGGGGGSGWSGHPSTSGGSGGGGNSVVAASAGTAGQGFEGDIGSNTSGLRSGGGGGGASEKGGLGTAGAGGTGGDGLFFFGAYYAGGGGGGLDGTPLIADGGGAGGLGGGGAGSKGTTKAIDATPGTGGGGGGAGYNANGTGRIGGHGGSGIVIVRYVADDPVVQNVMATNVVNVSADLVGNLTSTGSAPSTAWLFWDTEDKGTNKTWANSHDFGVQPITYGLSWQATGLTPNTTNFFTFYASNALGDNWAQPSIAFKTRGAPVVDNAEGATLLGLHMATLNGRLIHGIEADVAFFWGEAPGTLTNEATVGATGEEGFSALLTGLQSGFTYYYRAYATNAYGEGWAAAVTNFTTTAESANIFVAPTASGLSDGSSWELAFTNLQTALDAVPAGGNIYVKGATYNMAAELDWTVTGVSIRGGYVGNENGGLPGDRDMAAYPTVIRRDETATHRVLKVYGVTNGLLQGVSLRGGLTAAKDAGAGIHIGLCSDFVLDTCVIEGNRALNTAGNLGNLEGGGAYISNSVVLVTNVMFRGNTNQTLYGSTISHALGGGAAVLGGEVTFSDCLFANNLLIAGRNAYGAGLYLFGGTHRIENTVFQGNYAPLSASGITYNRGDAIHVSGAATDVTLHNSLVAANSRDGIHVENGTMQVVNTTVVGHGRYGVRRVAGTLAITNSILWQNDQDAFGTVSLGYCLVGDGTDVGTNGNIGGDPLFVRGLYLAPGSPAIDAGTNTAAFWELDGRTTATNSALDSGAVDLGYHFRPGTPASVADRQVAFDPALADLYVAETGNDANPGTVSNPFRSITRALATASAGSRIHVGAGLYSEAIETFPLTADKPGTQLLGAGADSTIVRANGAATSSRVMELYGVVGDGRLYGLTFTGGHIPKTAPNTILTYAFDNFWHPRRGGGLRIVYSCLEIDSVTVSNNTLRGAVNENILGGGIYALSSFVTMTNSLVAQNTLADGQSNTGDGYGGGLFLQGGQWLITDSVISNNAAAFANNGGNRGGGLYMDGAKHLVRNTVFIDNQVAGGGGRVQRGGGVYMLSGTIEDCVIVTNWMPLSTSIDTRGGGVYMLGGLLRNSLVTQNRAIRDGGAIYATGGSIESVTVAGNRAVDAGYVAGVVLTGTATASNSIFYANYRDFDGADASVADAGGTLAYSCTTPARDGIGNTGDTPQFADIATGDYRLRPGSPAIDSALEQDWMAAAVDADGEPRVRNGTPDMGVYESEPPDEGPLRINFIADERQGIDSLTVTFTAYVQGANTNGLVYSWDFENDGFVDQDGTDKRVVTNVFTPGWYDVRLVVLNSVPESESLVKTDHIFVSASMIYVWSGGDHSDGTSWAKAFTNIQAALDFASVSNTIYVAGETFLLSGQLVWASKQDVSILGGYEGVGTPGDRDLDAWPTIIRRNPAAGNFRIMYVSDVQAGLLSGVTIADGYTTEVAGSPAPGSGAGIRMLASSLEIENCVFTNNQGRTSGNSYMWGGGLFAQLSTVDVRDTLFVHNLAFGGPVASANNRALGGGLAVENCALTVDRCRFLRNDADSGGWHGSWGGGVYTVGGSGLIRNTLFAFNRAAPNQPRGFGGGIYMNAGIVLENVTVASNQVWNNVTTNTAGGIYVGGGWVTNAIAYHNENRSTPAPADVYAVNLGVFAYSCATELTNSESFNITADPLFTDLAGGDFLPQVGSPCRNTGLFQDWMTGATDLDGRPRVLNGLPDMGALEIPPPSGTVIWIR